MHGDFPIPVTFEKEVSNSVGILACPHDLPDILSYLNFSLLHFITGSFTRFPYQTYILIWKWPEWKCKRDYGEVENLSSRIQWGFLVLFCFSLNWKIIPNSHWSLHSVPALAAKLMIRLELCELHPAASFISWVSRYPPA